MSLYEDVKELLDPIDLTLDMMKKFIQPTIYSGLKSNIEAVYFKTKQQEKKDERAKKVEELLGLYRLKDDLIEEYQVNDSLLERQQTLGAIQGVREEIEALEEELKSEK